MVEDVEETMVEDVEDTMVEEVENVVAEEQNHCKIAISASRRNVFCLSFIS